MDSNAKNIQIYNMLSIEYSFLEREKYTTNGITQQNDLKKTTKDALSCIPSEIKTRDISKEMCSKKINIASNGKLYTFINSSLTHINSREIKKTFDKI
ncbi:hypothetical protein ACS016_14560 [Aeromonas veronii]|uniref:hypothetical protein n=1 Tax=Aeromonas veronii TaxID=654 RepID=UPI003F7B6B7E